VRSPAAGRREPRRVGERRLSQARLSAAAQERRRLARDLHDGVQNELVSLIIGLSVAGLDAALRAQAGLASMAVSLAGTAPRSTDDAEEAVYFACLEALQNVAKHARRDARVTLRMAYGDQTLAVRIEDDGGGFTRARRREGAGLTNIRDRVAAVGGTVRITSTPGRGTVVAVALPWPAKPAAPICPLPISASAAPANRP
jgi:signal transduction histidine kinase